MLQDGDNKATGVIIGVACAVVVLLIIVGFVLARLCRTTEHKVLHLAAKNSDDACLVPKNSSFERNNDSLDLNSQWHPTMDIPIEAATSRFETGASRCVERVLRMGGQVGGEGCGPVVVLHRVTRYQCAMLGNSSRTTHTSQFRSCREA